MSPFCATEPKAAISLDRPESAAAPCLSRRPEYDGVFFTGIEEPVAPLRRPLTCIAAQAKRDDDGQPAWKCSSPRPASSVESPPLDDFLVWLFGTAGLEAGAYRSNALNRRIPACLRMLRVSTTREARKVLERNPELLSRAVDAVLIGVSGFFRDESVFDLLSRSVLPSLLQAGQGLAVCSLGCSDGQELCSMAIVLSELGASCDSYLLGIDCRPGAIGRARAGWFPESDLELVPGHIRNRYFRSEQGGMRTCAPLRERMHWHLGNVLPSGPPVLADRAGWDLILFRNVAIYFEPSEAGGVWARLFQRLRPGGVLVTGKAERPLSSLPFRRLGPCIYEKTTKEAL